MPTSVLALSNSGTILDASPSVRHLLGFSPAGLVDLPVASLIHSRHRAAWNRAWAAAAQQAPVGRLRLRMRRAGHGWTQCSAAIDPGPAGTFTLRLDAYAGAELLLYRDLMEQFPEGLLLFDPATLCLRYSNAAARRWLRRNGARLRRRSIYELLPVEAANLRDAIEGSRERACTLAHVGRPRAEGADESAGMAEIRLSRFQSSGPEGLLVTIRPSPFLAAGTHPPDARQSQRLMQLGTMAGTLAHDFNNLATVILSYSGQLLTETSEPARRAALEISDAARSATSLCQRLLALSRGQPPPQAAPLDLNRVVATMAPWLLRLLRSDIDFEIAGGDEPATVRADSGQIEQIILNLVVNARDAMPEGGSLRLCSGRTAVEAGPDGVPAGEYAGITVTDTGVGMDAETQRRIFEPFFTTKGPQGTGLGLATVRRIVEESGGYISVTSRPGAGSSFIVLFPLVHAPQPAPL